MKMNSLYRGLLLASALALSACGKGSAPAPLAFPSEPSGSLEIKYPLDETLFQLSAAHQSGGFLAKDAA